MKKNAKQKTGDKPPCPRDIIAREEWDFDTNADGTLPGYTGCPDEELRFCRFYEYSRESKGLKEAIRASQKTNDLMIIHDGDHRIVLLLCYFKKLFPEFPNDPWLKIPSAKRKDRCGELTEMRVPQRPLIFDLSDVVELSSTTSVGVGEESNLELELENQTKHRLQIDWEFSDAQLRNSFVEWLKTNRPKHRPDFPRHGKSKLNQSVIRANLRSLAAFRLVQALGDKDKAIEHVRQKLKAGADTKSGLHTCDEKTWKRGIKDAALSIKNIVGPLWGDEDSIKPYCKDNKVPKNPNAESIWDSDFDEESGKWIMTEKQAIRTFIARQ